MNTVQDPKVYTYPANADLSTKQYFFVKPVTGGKVDLLDSATTVCIGVLQNKPSAANMAAEVALYGPCKVVVGGTVAVGDRLGTDTAGKAVALTANNSRIMGTCMQAGAAGDVVQMILSGGEAWIGA
jgi:hypothetical protein